jgi:dihydrofolate synthase/folylpolyglutamate synthase
MRLGLDRIEALLAALGRPEAGLRIVHIGGTNGKGSVAALTATILQAAPAPHWLPHVAPSAR